MQVKLTSSPWRAIARRTRIMHVAFAMYWFRLITVSKDQNAGMITHMIDATRNHWECLGNIPNSAENFTKSEHWIVVLIIANVCGFKQKQDFSRGIFDCNIGVISIVVPIIDLIIFDLVVWIIASSFQKLLQYTNDGIVGSPK